MYITMLCVLIKQALAAWMIAKATLTVVLELGWLLFDGKNR